MTQSTSPCIELDVSGLSHDGRGVCRLDNKVVFVRNALPGQRILARITADKARFAEAVSVATLQQTADYIPPACPHADTCGACPLQTLLPTAQLRWKHTLLTQNLHRIAGLRHITPAPVIPSPQMWQYRNKVALAFAPQPPHGIVLGFRAAASHQVVCVENCLLMSDTAHHAMQTLAMLVNEHLADTGTDFWRFAVIRTPVALTAEGSRQMHVSCITGPACGAQKKCVAHIGRQLLLHTEATGFSHDVRRRNDNIAQGERTLLHLGQSTIYETLLDVQYSFEHTHFFQVNTGAAQYLARLGHDYAALTTRDTIWDLYCGVGAPGLNSNTVDAPLWGVESAPRAATMALRNAQNAGNTHATYVCGDTRRSIGQWPAPHTVLVDPPRAGMHADVVRLLRDAAPRTIIYISCNPATLARDLALFHKAYVIQRVQPVDLFPHTPHIESVTHLTRK